MSSPIRGKQFLITGAAGSVLALSPVFAQSAGNDPLLDGMLSPSPTATPAATPNAPQPTNVPARRIDSDSTKLLTEQEGIKELNKLAFSENAYEGQKIAKVSVHYINQKETVDANRLRDVVALRPGMKYSSKRVDDDLKRLVTRGLVDSDSRVAVEPMSDGLHVIFEVSAAKLLGGVGYQGNREFDNEDLSEEIGKAPQKPGDTNLVAGQALNDKNIAQARAKILKAYQEARYPDARVEWFYAKTPREGYADLIFRIQEGKKVNMIDIDFEGNTAFDAPQLRQIMKTKEKGWLTWITKSGRIDREQLEDDLDALIKHYQNFGYLRAKIKTVTYGDSGKGNEQRLHMKVTIDEGPRYMVNRVAFGPMKVFQPDELVPGLSMLDGDIYSLQKVSDDITMIRKYYGSRGYADAMPNADIDEVGVDAQGRRLINITYNISEGTPYRVGRINVKGNTKTKNYVILRELPLHSGDNLNSVDIETARKRLENLNYFNIVDVSQTASATPGYRDIDILVQEKMTGSLMFGIAFSTVGNAYLYATVTQSNFDLYDWSSFVGGGQRMTVSGKLGTEYQSASVTWVDPWFLDRKLSFGTELYYSNSDYLSDYYTQQNFGTALFLRKALTDNTALRLEYRIERYMLDANWDAPTFFRENCGDFNRSHIELSYEYDTRDAVITPRKGGNVRVLGGWSGPGSTVQTYNLGLEASSFWNLKWDTIFSIKLGAATVDTTDSSKEVPIFERCYLGGPNDLRGFRYRDVGINDPALTGDETMGGRSSFYAQFEYTVPVIEEVRLAFFYDIGFVHKDAFEFNGGKVASDYGIGLRLNLPFGPLAVDYAIPLRTGNAIDDGGQFQFYVNYQY